MNYAAYGLIGLIGQLLSGLSLAYAVYSLVLAQLDLAEQSNWQLVGLLFLAVLVALFTELANRKLARPSIKPWVQKDKFAEDAEARQRHLILTRSYRIILLLVAVLSYFLSGVGSVSYAEDTAPPAQLIALDSIEQVYSDKATAIETAFAADTTLIVPVFRTRLAAARTRFDSDSLALMKERSRYHSCAAKGNIWCEGKLTEYLSRIDRARQALADSVSVITREQNLTLQSFVNQREDKLREQGKERQAELKTARTENEMRETKATQESGFQGLLFLLLTVVGQTVFYLMVYLQLQIEAGSGIEHEISPNEFWDKASLPEEVGSTLSWRVERGLRRLLAWVFSEPDANKTTAIPYWSLEVVKQDQTPTNTSLKAASCAVKGTRTSNANLADLKQRLKMYRKRLGAQEQKAIAQKRKKGSVDKRTQKAIDNNRRWVDHYLQEIKQLEGKPSTVNGTDVEA